MNRNLPELKGAKGGGGGASFVTKPDTLRSNDTFEILFGLGSGRWKGLKEGLRSLKINNIPMENADGSSNFEGVQAIFADGNPLEDQLVLFKLGGAANVQAVSTQLSNPNASGTPGPWISGSNTTINANFIDLRFVVQQLLYQDDKGIRENTATIEIEMRPSNDANWVNIFSAPNSNAIDYNQDGYSYEYDGANYQIYLAQDLWNPGGTSGFVGSNSTNLSISGKATSSPSVKELRVEVPNTGDYANISWEVRARLVEPDTESNDPIQQSRVIIFETISAITETVLGDDPEWDGLVWLQLIGKATDQFNGFPQVDGVYDTKICQTPPTTVWNPETRVYNPVVWDGTYEEHFTTDPAWQMKEFIEDPEHGVAGLYPSATLDKWDTLEASQYYSEQVNDGKGGTHPRFNMNLTINESREIQETLQFLAGSVNSFIGEIGGGQYRLKVDKPEAPVMLFTEDNVFSEFTYSHTDVDTRYNDWRGTFLNEDFDYKEDDVRVFDQPDIDLRGTKFTEIALVGCTNRQEALRRLMFRLKVSLNEYKIVNFTTNRAGRYLRPLDTILVADGSLNTDFLAKSTSRVQSTATTTITLHKPIRLEVGVAYQAHFTLEDRSVVTRLITTPDGSRGDVTVINIDSILPVNLMKDSPVALEAIGLGGNPIPYRVISVERSDEGEDSYGVSAVIIDSGKWNAMDNVSEALINAQTPGITIGSPLVPSGGMFSIQNYTNEFGDKIVLQVNWDRPTDATFLDSYRVEYRLNDGPWIIAAESVTDTFFEFQNAEDGTYDWRITAKDRRGVQSRPLEGRVVIDGAQIQSGIETRRFPDNANLLDMPIGSLYYDEFNQPYRRESGNLSFDGVDLTFGGDPLSFDGFVSVQDGVLRDAIRALQSVDDDGILTIDEKIRIVIPEDSRLEAEYQGILAQANAIGLSIANLTTARNNWIALRDSLSPAWNDTDQATTITRTDWDSILDAYRNARAEAQADLVAPSNIIIEWPQNQIISLDAAGAVEAGQYPLTLTPQVKLGTVDVTDSDDVSYSITPTGVTATVDNVNASPTKGQIEVTAGTGGNIVFEINYKGVPFTQTILLTGVKGSAATFSANTFSFEFPLPNGDIILMQGGTDTVPANTSDTYAFSPTYSVAPVVSVTGNSSDTSREGNAGLVGNPSTTQFTANNSTAVAITINWIAIGKK